MARRRGSPEIVAQLGDLIVQRDPARPSGRLLRQGDMDASYVDLADVGHLEFDYLRRMRDLVEAAQARRVLHIGGAACALARALAAADPDGRQEVAELDPDVLAIAREHLGLRRMPGLRVRVADGRTVLAARADHSADAVLIDAFVGARVPRRIADRGALAEVARVLAPGGVVAINVVDAPPLRDVRAIAAGLLERFGAVAATGPGSGLPRRRSGNVVLMAADGPLPIARLRSRAAADPSPAGLIDTDELAELCVGTAPWDRS
jgi:spermidine synthase